MYRNMIAKKEMCTIIGDIKGEQQDNAVVSQCIEISKNLIDFQLYAYSQEEFIPGFDIFGDGLMYYERLDE